MANILAAEEDKFKLNVKSPQLSETLVVLICLCYIKGASVGKQQSKPNNK